MEKQTITNRKGQRIVVLVEEAKNPKGLAIIIHGLSGNKEQSHIATFAEAFREKGYTVLRFDTTNTFGESEGEFKNATVTSYYKDLEDVTDWAKTQKWYIEPFILVGHSIGGLSSLLYAEKYPYKIKGLAPISTVISGELTKQALSEKAFKDWQKTGWRTEKSSTSPTGIKEIPWSYMIDLLRHNGLQNANKLTMPVLLIVGDKDMGTPYKHQKLLYDKLPGRKEIHIIKNAPHTFKEQEQLEEIKHLFLTWIDTL